MDGQSRSERAIGTSTKCGLQKIEIVRLVGGEGTELEGQMIRQEYSGPQKPNPR
jgi:hypothetical protein